MSGHAGGHLSILASSLFPNSHVSQKALCPRQLSNGESRHTEPLLTKVDWPWSWSWSETHLGMKLRCPQRDTRQASPSITQVAAGHLWLLWAVVRGQHTDADQTFPLHGLYSPGTDLSVASLQPPALQNCRLEVSSDHRQQALSWRSQIPSLPSSSQHAPLLKQPPSEHETQVPRPCQ